MTSTKYFKSKLIPIFPQKRTIPNSFYEVNITLIPNQRHPKKTTDQGFPGGAVVENLPANAGDTGLSPGLGGSHVLRSSWAREPQLLSLRIWSLCSTTGEATMVRGPHTAIRSGPRLLQLEKALAQKRRPNTAKKLKNK